MPQLPFSRRKGPAPEAAGGDVGRTCAPLLQAQTSEDFLEFGMLAQVR